MVKKDFNELRVTCPIIGSNSSGREGVKVDRTIEKCFILTQEKWTQKINGALH